MLVPEPIHLTEIGQIALTVQDLDRARAFYQNTLGMPLLFNAGSMAFFQCGGIRLMIGLAESPTPVGGTILYFRVHDIQAAHESLVARGVRFTQGPHVVSRMTDHDLWMCAFEDTEGNPLQLMSEVR